MIEITRNQTTVRSELVEWRFVRRYSRKGYMERDFFISGRRYRQFASGANERGIVRYGYRVEEPDA